jgi:hypothetical protein
MPSTNHQTYHDRVPTRLEAAVEGEWSAGETLLKDLSNNEGVHDFQPEVITALTSSLQAVMVLGYWRLTCERHGLQTQAALI